MMVAARRSGRGSAKILLLCELVHARLRLTILGCDMASLLRRSHARSLRLGGNEQPHPQEIAMNGKSSAILIHPMVVIAVVAAMLTPSVCGPDAAAGPSADQAGTDRAGSAPVIVAQGRCFNGKCF
jgi:hypothetical protein